MLPGEENACQSVFFIVTINKNGKSRRGTTNMTAEDFIAHSESWCSAKGMECRRGAEFPEFGLYADFFALKTGKSLGPFFPYEDYFFFHVMQRGAKNDREELTRIHEAARAYVNSRYKVPKMMRLKVPNIITIAVSETSFPIDAVKYSKEDTTVITGGEKHSVYLVDLLQKGIVSQGIEITYSEGFPFVFNNVNPTNRAFHTVSELVKDFLDNNK